MPVTINGTSGIVNNATDLNYTGTLTGGTGVVNLGSGQLVKDAAGNLGLGVTPSAWGGFKALQVQAGCLASNQFSAGNLQTYMGSNVYFDGSGYRYIVSGSAAARYAQNENSHIWFTAPSGTAGNAISFTQAMTLDSLGTLIIGATTNGYGVAGGIYAPAINGYTTASAANMFIETGGFMRRSTSSLKYKTDVQDAAHGLAKVMQLRAVTYKGINDGDKVFGGLVAEEVHEAGLTEFVQYAEDGTPDALAYSHMVSLAFKAIQEQQATIQSLTQRISALEGASDANTGVPA